MQQRAFVRRNCILELFAFQLDASLIIISRQYHYRSYMLIIV